MSDELELKPERVMGWLRKRLIRLAKTYDEYQGKYDIPIDEARKILNQCLRMIDALLNAIIAINEKMSVLIDETIDLLEDSYTSIDLEKYTAIEIIDEDPQLLIEARAIELYLVDVLKGAKAEV